MVQPLWAMCSTVGCPHGSTVSPYIVLDLSCFKLWLMFPALPPRTAVSFTKLQKLTNRTLTLSLHPFADFLFFQWKYGYLYGKFKPSNQVVVFFDPLTSCWGRSAGKQSRYVPKHRREWFVKFHCGGRGNRRVVYQSKQEDEPQQQTVNNGETLTQQTE